MVRNLHGKPAQILYIGRVDSTCDAAWQLLSRDGVSVAVARTQQAGLTMALQMQPQVVVVNTTNSHFSGDRLCRSLGRRLPSAQRLLIAEAGAVCKAPCEQRLLRPFTSQKLRNSVLKLLQAAEPHVLKVGPLELDLVTRIVSGPNGQCRLTPKQCDLLALLMQRPNQVLSRKDLMERIWETDFMGDTRTLDVHIRWLREKIEPVPSRPVFLLTRRGVGYVLAIPELEVPGEETTPSAD